MGNLIFVQLNLGKDSRGFGEVQETVGEDSRGFGEVKERVEGLLALGRHARIQMIE